MNWLNLETKTRTAPEFIGSEPTERATWLCLMLHCAEHENGGTIAGAVSWGNRRWMQTAGVTKDEINADCDLWTITGADLILWGYPKEKEKEVMAMRNGGRKGGKKSRRKPTLQAPFASPPLSPPLSPPVNGRERKGKKGNGIRREEEAEVDTYPRHLQTLEENKTIENAIAAITAGHPAFSSVASVHLENSFKSQPDRDRWPEAIRGLVSAYAGAELNRPNKTLLNWLQGKPAADEVGTL